MEAAGITDDGGRTEPRASRRPLAGPAGAGRAASGGVGGHASLSRAHVLLTGENRGAAAAAAAPILFSGGGFS